jgi:hypothetical protein
MKIIKAVRQKVFMKVGISGPSGSGKTWAALGIAKGMSEDGRVLVIDSENGSASFYSGSTDEPGQWAFDTIPLKAPFTPESYIEAVNAAVDAGYSVVVIDSLSHEWASSGGILDAKAAKDARGGNSFTNWNGLKQVHNSFIEALLQAQIHVIATLRSKTEYVLETVNKNGRDTQAPRRVGMAPVSSDGIEYEFTAVFDLDRNSHMAIASKDRTGMFGNQSFFLNAKVGKQLKEWRDGGAVEAHPAPVPETQAAAPIPLKPQPKARKKKADEPVADASISNVTIANEQLIRLESLVANYKVSPHALADYLLSKGYLEKADHDRPLQFITEPGIAKMLEIFSDGQRAAVFANHIASTYSSAVKTA